MVAICQLGFYNSQTFGHSSAWESEYALSREISSKIGQMLAKIS